MKLEEIKTALEMFFARAYKNPDLNQEIVLIRPADNGEDIEVVFKDDAENLVISKRGEDQSQYNLKPCPFCGGEAVYRTTMGVYWVKCIKCGVSIDAAGDKKTANERWNQRAEEEDTRINVYENMWNALLRECNENSYVVVTGRGFLDKMNFIERIQKGIPEEDDDEE